MAWVAGWIGVAALAVCGVLWLAGRNEASLTRWTLGSLLLASLVGWSYVNEGQNALARQLPRALTLAAFFLLPLACGAAALFEAKLAHATGFAPPDHPFWLFVFWYPPLTVVTCAAVYLKRQALPRTRLHFWRALGSLALLLPYALLFAYLVLHLRVEPLEGPLHETLGSLGQYAIIVQLLLAYFVGNAAE